MKEGVILINVSRGAIFNSRDVYNALQDGFIAKIGMDVYEFEHNVFFFDHSRSPINDKLLKAFIQNSRVLLTPHQAFLTKEALQVISAKTIENLDKWFNCADEESKFPSTPGNLSNQGFSQGSIVKK
jgi:D-lactate dehydrogenase